MPKFQSRTVNVLAGLIYWSIFWWLVSSLDAPHKIVGLVATIAYVVLHRRTYPVKSANTSGSSAAASDASA